MTRRQSLTLAAKRMQKIGRLEKLLKAERAVTRAFSKLVFLPSQQDSYALGQVRKAITMRDQLINQSKKEPNQ